MSLEFRNPSERFPPPGFRQSFIRFGRPLKIFQYTPLNSDHRFLPASFRDLCPLEHMTFSTRRSQTGSSESGFAVVATLNDGKQIPSLAQRVSSSKTSNLRLRHRISHRPRRKRQSRYSAATETILGFGAKVLPIRCLFH